MRTLFVNIFLTLLCIALSGASDDAARNTDVLGKDYLVSRRDFVLGESWKLPGILDRDFWHIVNTGRANSNQQYRKSKAKDDLMIRDAGFHWDHCSSIISKMPSMFSLLTAEKVEIYGINKTRNLTDNATVERNIEGTDNFYPANSDGVFSPLISAEGRRDIQKGYFTLKFKTREKINMIIVKQDSWCSQKIDFIPRFFSLEYMADNKEWKTIPELRETLDESRGHIFSFPELSADSIRFSVHDGNDPGILSVDLLEQNLDRSAEYVDLSKVPFFAFCMPWTNDYGIYRSTISYKYFKVEKEAFLKWKEKHKFAFFRFFPGEWGCDFYICSNWDGQWTDFRKKQNIDVIIPKPKSREEAFNYVKDYYEKRKKVWFDSLLDFTNMVPWNHYQLEWGATETGIETTAYGGPSHQVQVAFCRGAARQYHSLWGWYMAYYWQTCSSPSSAKPCRIYETERGDGSGSKTPFGGISVSLAKRDMYLAYFSGAAFLTHECWPDAFFKPSVPNNYDSVWELSQHGKAVQEWFAFTQKNKERGVSYTPIAILLDYYHGWSDAYTKKHTWFYFPIRQQDNMITSFMYTLFPWIPDRQDNDTRLFNSPYGDIYDALIANPPSGKLDLSPYKVAVLLGDIKPDKTLAAKLQDYVQKGGTLVINAKQMTPEILPSFLGLSLSGKSVVCGKKLQSLLDDESIALPGNYNCESLTLNGAKAILVDENKTPVMTVNDYGKGKVILTTPDWMVEKDLNDARQKSPLAEFLLKRIVPEVLPFKVEGNIEYGFNKISDGWLVYLINNRGVHKTPLEAAMIDTSEFSAVKINFGKSPEKIHELVENKEVPVSDPLAIDVPPGDIRILKIRIE